MQSHPTSYPQYHKRKEGHTQNLNKSTHTDANTDIPKNLHNYDTFTLYFLHFNSENLKPLVSRPQYIFYVRETHSEISIVCEEIQH